MNRLREQTRDWVIIGLGAWVIFPPVWFVVPPPPWGHHWMMRNGFLPPHEGPDLSPSPLWGRGARGEGVKTPPRDTPDFSSREW